MRNPAGWLPVLFVDLTEPDLTSTGEAALMGTALGESMRDCEVEGPIDIDCDGLTTVLVVHDRPDRRGSGHSEIGGGDGENRRMAVGRGTPSRHSSRNCQWVS